MNRMTGPIRYAGAAKWILACFMILFMDCVLAETDTALPIHKQTSTSSLYKLLGRPLPDAPNSGDVLTNSNKYLKVDAGSTFVCGIRQKDRGLDCWGQNDLGQLNAPKGKFKQLSLGEMHGCAIRLDNRMACWGASSARPDQKQAKGQYLQVSSGDSHTCAIRKGSRAIVCWGDNQYGQSTAPAGHFKQVSVRNNQACALTTEKGLVCWGESAFTSFSQPMGEFIDVSVGKLHGCAVRDADRSVVCWGNNQFGIVSVPTGILFKEVSSGDYHSCATVQDDNRLMCWGRDQWGQVSQVPSDPIFSAGLGGALTCVTNLQRNILCKGSYAYNDVMSDTVNKSAQSVQVASEEGRSQSKGIWGFVGGVVAHGAGYGLKAWGESMESGSTGQKFVLFAAGLLGAKADKNKERFKEIQVNLKEIQQQLTGIDRQVKETYLAVQQLSCQEAMTELKKYRETVDSANVGYQILVGKVLTDLTHQQQGLSPDLTLLPEIDRYAGVWDDPVSSQLRDVLRNTHRFLVSNESPFIKCMNADLETWRKTAGHPFDDRKVYEGIYSIQELSELMQLQAAIILQDVNARRVIKALRDPVFARQPEAPAIAEGLVPDSGLCAEARSQVASWGGGQIPLAKARWLYAAEYCDDSSQVVKDTYKRLVQQIEFAGAPYTTNSVVTSLSGKVFGHGNSTKNWLWINLSKVDSSEISFMHSEYPEGFPLYRNASNGFMSILFKNGGEANWYSGSSSSSRAGIWVGASQAWDDVYSSYDDYLKANNKKDDLLEMMGRLESPYLSEDGTQSTVKLLPKITDTPFWISSKKYDLEWNRLAGDDLTNRTTHDVRCFVAAGINPTWYYSSGGSGNPHETLRLTGKVCSSEEFAAMGRRYPITNPRWGNGAVIERNYPGADEFYEKYQSVLGGWQFMQYGPDYQLIKPTDAKYFIDGTLMHYPVVDLNSRPCRPSIVKLSVAGDPQVDRQNMIIRGDGVEIPTRCGEDMDRFIEDRVPRPLLPVIPDEEVRQLVFYH